MDELINELVIFLNAEHRKMKDNMMDRKSTALQGDLKNRPNLARASEAVCPHFKAVDSYIRQGDEAALRQIELDGKGMNLAVNAEGGFLVDSETSAQVYNVLAAGSSLRSIAQVVKVETSSFDVLVDLGDLGAGWAGESEARNETESSQFTRVTIPLYELSAMPKASQRLLDDAAFDVETWLAARIADKFSRAESNAFINGDGVEKPKGILAYDVVVNDVWEWGQIGAVNSGDAAGFAATNGGDAIIDLIYSLETRYRQNAKFVMNYKTAGHVRKMKDVDGRFLWNDALQAQAGAHLVGYPVQICEDMPDVAADATPIVFGDFSSSYTIAERPDIRILRDPFSAKPHVLFYATKRVGGDVTDFAAMKALKIAV